MKPYLLLFFLLFLVVLKPYLADASRDQVYSISGKVQKVEESRHELTVGGKNEKTGATILVRMRVTLDTNFYRVSNLRQLKLGDTVSVDYVQGERGRFMARRIELM